MNEGYLVILISVIVKKTNYSCESDINSSNKILSAFSAVKEEVNMYLCSREIPAKYFSFQLLIIYFTFCF